VPDSTSRCPRLVEEFLVLEYSDPNYAAVHLLWQL